MNLSSDSLPAPGETRNLILQAGAGDVEAVLSAPKRARERPGFAVVCHPHPLMGGALSNKVTFTLAASALKTGLYALRFNFRGVGRSAGTHDQGQGEVDDAVALFRWMQAQLPDAQTVFAGYSFGGYVALSAAALVHPDALVTVAPPFRYFSDRPTPQPQCPWMLIHGTDDQIAAYADTQDKMETLSPKPQLVSPDGTGHFFHRRLDVVRENTVSFLEQQLQA